MAAQTLLFKWSTRGGAQKVGEWRKVAEPLIGQGHQRGLKLFLTLRLDYLHDREWEERKKKRSSRKGEKYFFFSFSLNLLSECIYCPGDNGSKNSPRLLRRATIRNTQLVEILALRDDTVTLRDQTRSRFSFQ